MFLIVKIVMKANKKSYQSKSGFKTPPSYFNGLEEEVCDMISFSETLGTKKTTGFNTPTGYFEELENGLLDKVGHQQKKPKVRALFSKDLLLYAASIAAIVIALASTFYLNPKTTTSWENVQLSVMEDYIDENNIDFSTSEISNYIFTDGYIVDDSDLSGLNANAMIDYLDENMDDPIYILQEK